MLVLDTDILSIIQRAAGLEYLRLVRRLPANEPRSVHVTIVSFEEQMRGWLAYIAQHRQSDRQIRAYAKLHELLQDFSRRRILDFDKLAFEQYQHLLKSRVRIGTMDLRIAAIALVHKATLISRNLADFRKVPGLHVEDWTSEQD